MSENLLIKFEVLPNTKEKQKALAQDVINKMLNGEIDPLKVKIYFKSVIDTIKIVLDNDKVKAIIIDEADKYEGKEFDVFGAHVTMTKKTAYDYSTDQKWNDINNQKKVWEKFLKTIPEGCEIVDKESGELTSGISSDVTRYLKIEFK